MSKIPVYKISNYEQNKPNHNDIYIKSFSDHVCEYDFIDKPHSHDFFLFVLCTKGSGKHKIDFETYDFKPNRLFILKPGQIHHWSLSKDIEGSILFFRPSFYFTKYPQKSALELPLLRTMSTINFVDFSEKKGLQIGNVFNELAQNYKTPSPSINEIFASYLNILIHQVTDHIVETTPAFSSKSTDSNFHYILKFEDLLEQHFKDQHRVSFYAQNIGISPEHLNRLCKKYFIKSSKKIINDRIVLEAMRMLSKNENSILTISEELQFSDLSNFVKFFKRETSTTPAKFRQEQG